MSQITTLEQLRELYSQPAPLAVAKDLHHIDKHTRTFIVANNIMSISQ